MGRVQRNGVRREERWDVGISDVVERVSGARRRAHGDESGEGLPVHYWS